MDSINRAEQLYKNWQSKENELKGLIDLGEGGNKAIQELKYKFLSEGITRISINPTDKEKMHLHVLRSVTKNLQKELYPNRFLRALHIVKSILIDRPILRNRFAKIKQENLVDLQDKLRKVGLSQFGGKLDNYLDYERSKVSIDLSSQISNDKGLNIKIILEKDDSGKYRLNEYQATLVPNNLTEKPRSFIFSAESKINVFETSRLLEGKAIRKSVQMDDGSIGKKWLQLDLNSKDNNGNQILKEFQKGYNYDLAGLLAQYSKSIGIDNLSKDKIINSLENGNQVKINVPGKGEFTIEANPGERKINIYDKDKKPVELASLSKKNLQSQGKQQNQSKTIKLEKATQHEVSQSQMSR